MSAPFSIPIRFDADQLQELAKLVAKELSRGSQQQTVSPEELGAMLGVSGKTVRRRITAGVIASVPNIGVLRVPADEVERLTHGGNDQ
jgi:hypothetical protein